MKPPRFIPIPADGPQPLLTYTSPLVGEGPEAVGRYLERELGAIQAMLPDTRAQGLVLLTGPLGEFDGLFAKVAPPVEAQLAYCVARCRAAGVSNLSVGVTLSAALLAVLVRSGSLASAERLRTQHHARGDATAVVVLLPEGTGTVLLTDEGEVFMGPGGDA